mgnify:CR=1 FL=1
MGTDRQADLIPIADSTFTAHSHTANYAQALQHHIFDKPKSSNVAAMIERLKLAILLTSNDDSNLHNRPGGAHLGPRRRL